MRAEIRPASEKLADLINDLRKTIEASKMLSERAESSNAILSPSIKTCDRGDR